MALKFIQEHIWGHLPENHSRKTVVISAAIWMLGIPGIAWTFHYFGRFSDRTFLIFAGVGGTLGAAQLIPVLGESVYTGILRVTSIFGYFVFRAGLIVVFYLIVTPMGLALRLAGKDPLELKRTEEGPTWKAHHGRNDAARYYRLF